MFNYCFVLSIIEANHDGVITTFIFSYCMVKYTTPAIRPRIRLRSRDVLDSTRIIYTLAIAMLSWRSNNSDL